MLLVAFFASVSTMAIVSLPISAATWAAWAPVPSARIAAETARNVLGFIVLLPLGATPSASPASSYEEEFRGVSASVVPKCRRVSVCLRDRRCDGALVCHRGRFDAVGE